MTFSAEYYGELEHGLRGILAAVKDKLTSPEVDLLTSLIDHNEPGVALEWCTSILIEDTLEISPAVLEAILTLARRMGIDTLDEEQLRALVVESP